MTAVILQYLSRPHHAIGWKQSPMRPREDIHSKFTFIDKFIHFCGCPSFSQAVIWVSNTICYVFAFTGLKWDVVVRICYVLVFTGLKWDVVVRICYVFVFTGWKWDVVVRICYVFVFTGLKWDVVVRGSLTRSYTNVRYN